MGDMNAALDTTLELETPEHIAFRYQLAGPARRAAAYVVDLFVRGAILFVVALVMLFTSNALTSDFSGFETGALLLLFFVLEWGYFVAFDLLAEGASPGKKAFQLRVVHQDGRPITLTDSVLRNLLRAADLLPMFYAVGVLSMMLDHKFRRLGDFVAQTVVVYEPTSRLADRQDAGDRGEITGLPARPQLSAEEKNALALFYRRLPYLSEARALELADLIAPVFVDRYGLGRVDPMHLLIALHERSSAR
jgi:uncharacterized RDD family membrane protein YckC